MPREGDTWYWEQRYVPLMVIGAVRGPAGGRTFVAWFNHLQPRRQRADLLGHPADGRKHLGNYIGATSSGWRGRTAARRSTASSTCTRSPCPYEPAGLRDAVYDTAATLLAAGLDPDRCIFFRQSDVQEHTELAGCCRA